MILDISHNFFRDFSHLNWMQYCIIKIEKQQCFFSIQHFLHILVFFFSNCYSSKKTFWAYFYSFWFFMTFKEEISTKYVQFIKGLATIVT